MTETGKTFAFVGVAVAAIAIAFAARPRAVDFSADEMRGKVLYEFDVDAPKRLKIVKFDEGQSALSEFEVAEIDGKWSIPSKDGYPADADQQMADAALSVNHLEVLRVASEKADTHAELGVVDPMSPNLDAAAEGVGTHVTMLDGKGDTLVDMIVGDEVKEQEGQRYVRRANQDVTYVVNVDASKLSTNFSDWIEKDLLKLNPWDIREVQIRDFTVDRSVRLDGRPTATVEPKSEITLSYDDQETKWSADEIRVYNPEKKDYESVELAADEELDTAKLNDLKSGLDDLRIVDVEQKPQGLSDDLKASEDFVKSDESFLSLFMKGFVTTQGADGKPEILSSDGEVICTLKTGVEYVLRYGDFQLAGDYDPKKAEGEDVERDQVHRYLFVMAQFNEDAIDKPEIEELPPLPEGADASDAEAKSDEDSTDATTDEPKPEDAKDANDQPAADESTPEESTADGEEEEPAAEEAKKAEQTALEKAIEQRLTIEKENNRRREEYETKIKEGKEEVAKLNAQFGDWYYVIDDEVYKRDTLKPRRHRQKESAGGRRGKRVRRRVGSDRRRGFRQARRTRSGSSGRGRRSRGRNGNALKLSLKTL